MNNNFEQEFSSANTSINKTKLPAVYNKVNFLKLGYEFAGCGGLGVLDYGCGKYTEHLEKRLTKDSAFLVPYDKFNQSEEVNSQAIQDIDDGFVQCALCSNVLNVIKEEEIIEDIANTLQGLDIPYFVTVYEGDKSGEGNKSQDDCYQRNEKAKAYLKYFNNAVLKKGVITNAPEFLK